MLKALIDGKLASDDLAQASLAILIEPHRIPSDLACHAITPDERVQNNLRTFGFD
jgi:hypothetical protein